MPILFSNWATEALLNVDINNFRLWTKEPDWQGYRRVHEDTFKLDWDQCNVQKHKRGKTIYQDSVLITDRRFGASGASLELRGRVVHDITFSVMQHTHLKTKKTMLRFLEQDIKREEEKLKTTTEKETV